jgi:hypothetical protein
MKEQEYKGWLISPSFTKRSLSSCIYTIVWYFMILMIIFIPIYLFIAIASLFY